MSASAVKAVAAGALAPATAAQAERIARDFASVTAGADAAGGSGARGNGAIGGLPSSVVSAERRRAAIATLTSKGLPTTREDGWKYANLRTLEKVAFRSVAMGTRKAVAASDLPPAVADYARYVFVDGVFAPELSATGSQAGVTVTAATSSASAARNAASSLSGSAAASGGLEAAPSPVASSQTAAPTQDDRFALLNEAFATDGAIVHVPKNADCAACVEILFLATEAGQTAASYPRLELQVEANAKVGLIERHISAQGDGHSDANFVNGAVHVSVAAGAQVDHFRLQQVGSKATWIDTLTATVDKDARYCMHLVSLGALSARSTSRIELEGSGAEAAVHVVSLADGQQVHDGLAEIDHIAANTRSETNIRGIAAGRSRVAFNSKVVVSEHAKGTDSKQSLRGLLAGDQAEIDVRPQLEIYTDDVRCNHGATAGKLDDNMLFYLLSRGIEKDIAQQLLKWAFLEDVVSRIRIPELRKHIEQSLAGQLKETAALKELL
jgi:Fe-S cluster assembly protein SufD